MLVEAPAIEENLRPGMSERASLRLVGGIDVDAMLSRARRRAARLRRVRLLGLFGLAAVAACARIVAARAGRIDGGAVRVLLDATLVAGWTLGLVALPFAAAVKPKPVRAGALVALVCGPVLMPVVFGAGWGLVPAAAGVAACAVALAPARTAFAPRARR